MANGHVYPELDGKQLSGTFREHKLRSWPCSSLPSRVVSSSPRNAIDDCKRCWLRLAILLDFQGGKGFLGDAERRVRCGNAAVDRCLQ